MYMIYICIRVPPMCLLPAPSLELIKLYKRHECSTLITLCKVCQVFFKTFFYSTLYKLCQVFYKVFFRHLLNLSSFAKFLKLVYPFSKFNKSYTFIILCYKCYLYYYFVRLSKTSNT